LEQKEDEQRQQAQGAQPREDAGARPLDIGEQRAGRSAVGEEDDDDEGEREQEVRPAVSGRYRSGQSQFERDTGKAQDEHESRSRTENDGRTGSEYGTVYETSRAIPPVGNPVSHPPVAASADNLCPTPS